MARIPCAIAFFLFLTALSISQRQVTIQKGPLFRTEGYHISISCKVAGYQGPSEQHFQWSVYLPSAPTREIQVISTKDTDFTYAIYKNRVQSKDIYIERLQGDSVLLHISKLQMKDSAIYECHTPNTDVRYLGNYSAKTELIVIPDTLSAVMRPQTLNKDEGEPLELTCLASKDTAQHTHLSVTWYLKQTGKDSQATKIISLSRDFMLVPGPLYEERFAAHDVGLGKFGASTFRLSVERLQPTDQGQLLCEATEWIQDPDETWTPIATKVTDETTLKIRLAGRDIHINLTAQSTFTEGEPLELICLVAGRGRNPQFQIIWFFNEVEVASIGADGVLGMQKGYAERVRRGLFQVSKLDPKTFSLKILTLGPEDEGRYRCDVEEVTRTQTGSWNVLQKAQSPDSHVHLRKQAARQLVVSTKNKQQSVWEGEPLSLVCQADGSEGLLSVSWWHIPQGQTQPVFVAGMDHSGTIQRGPYSGKSTLSSSTRLEKVNWATFQLEVTSTTLTDGGTYECQISESPRIQASDRKWSQKMPITVLPLKSSLQVILNSRQPQVKLTGTFGLSCLVKADYSALQLPITVTWLFQPTASQDFHQLLRITHDGIIEWGDSPLQFPRKTKVSQSPFLSQLLIHDATEEEAGVFQCKVDVYDKISLQPGSPPKASAFSHPLRIAVTLPESKLTVNTSSQVQEISINSNTEIECSILSQSAGNLQLAIIWYFAPIFTNATWLRILEMNQTQVVKYEDQFPHRWSKHKFYSQKIAQDLFQLHILNVDNNDQGKYHCVVEEWLLSADGTWYKLEGKMSGITELKIRSTGREVRVSKVHLTENATEHGEAVITCCLEYTGNAKSLLSVKWFRNRGPTGSEMLVHLHRDGLLEYGEKRPHPHLHSFRNSSTEFVLQLWRVELEDAGEYWCEVTDWQLHGRHWINHAWDQSQRLTLTVLPAESTFPARLCSSTLLVYLLFISPFIVFFLLLVSLCCLYGKAKELSTLKLNEKKKDALWMDMKDTGDGDR